MKNIKVIEAFINKKSGNSLNLHSNGNKLFSYQTCIAEWNEDVLLLNITKYSITTSKHLTYVLRCVPIYMDVIKLNNIPKGAINLIKFYNK